MVTDGVMDLENRKFFRDLSASMLSILISVAQDTDAPTESRVMAAIHINEYSTNVLVKDESNRRVKEMANG